MLQREDHSSSALFWSGSYPLARNQRHEKTASDLQNGTESPMKTHDIEFQVANADGTTRKFRMVLLSSRDSTGSETEQRLERLYHFNGGRDAAVVFLLASESAAGSTMNILHELQIRYSSSLSAPPCRV